MTIPLLHIDAFTDTALRGNPAAVAVLDHVRGDEWLQAVAAEMNLSETAFVRQLDDGAWSLRWCTPTLEVDLCGHATLASAHALWELGLVEQTAPIAFDTRSGRLLARRQGDRIELEFPALFVSEPRAVPAEVLGPVGVRDDELSFSGRHTNGYWFLVLADAARVRELDPDFRVLGEQPDTVLVTAPSDDERADFVSRYFAPAHGIDEDPVTGSAHCLLGPYWSTRLGKPVVTGLQVSARTGIVECEPRGEHVLLRGHAVTVVRGELLVERHPHRAS